MKAQNCLIGIAFAPLRLPAGAPLRITLADHHDRPAARSRRHNPHA
jgi:hypothetical protein